MSGYVYLAVLDIVKEPAVSSNNSNGEQTPTKSSEPKYNTCAKLKQMKPSSPSGVYELDVNGSPKHVYCDMSAYGGGWALVVSISSSNNHHTLRAKNNCFNSSLCVSFATGTLVARKNSDTDIRALASYEGTFRVDVFNSAGSLLHTNFYRFPQGAQSFDAGCAGRGMTNVMLAAILFLMTLPKMAATKNNEITTISQFGYRFLDKRVLPDRKTNNLKACFDLCRETGGCRSINYNKNKGICELHSKSHVTHPQNLERRTGYIYTAMLDVKESQLPDTKYKTCAKLKQMKPSSPSGVYELDVNGSPKHVYCDMDNFGNLYFN
ncbi:hypothetical protein AC249_AIPGENE13922 [Exaiptasia diaphana]|nr:hypothetical protein AC249_AIPGENE13922 [Exaiptasia diaphana]